jgi:hypothetical protein
MRHLVAGHPLGLWIALFGLLSMLVVGGGGQILSLIDWDLAVRLGLQEYDRHSTELAPRLLAQVEWGVCLADAVLVVPLLVAGLVGVLCRRHWGVIVGMMAALCWVYMFLVYTAQRYALVFRGGFGHWDDYAGFIAGFALLALVPGVLTLWGLGANVDRFAVTRPNSYRLRRKQDGLEPFWLEDLLICTGQVLCTIPQVWIGKRLTWNTRPGEAARSLAGDAFVARGIVIHRAITIARPPELVWPWIAQFGRGAAYYSWDFLDNPGHRHPDYLLDGPAPLVGDWNAQLGRVRYLETGTELVWYDEPLFSGLKVPNAMTFRLDPEPDGGTRLHFRMSADWPEAGLRSRIALRVLLLMDQVMSTEMLRRLKLLIETYEERLANGESNRLRAPHQGTRWGTGLSS